MALIAILGVLFGFAVGYRYAAPAGKKSFDAVDLHAQGASVQAHAALQQLEDEMHHARVQLATVDGELIIERSARQELESQLRAAQAEADRLHDQLAFYEQLLPPGPEGTVAIRSVQIDRSGANLHYRVLLMRSGRKPSAPFKGTLSFQALGTLHGQATSVDLFSLQRKTDTTVTASKPAARTPVKLAVQFDQYQRSQGVLGLPLGFVLQSVTVSVYEGDTLRATRSVKLEL
jgi:hypothetical protein